MFSEAYESMSLMKTLLVNILLLSMAAVPTDGPLPALPPSTQIAPPIFAMRSRYHGGVVAAGGAGGASCREAPGVQEEVHPSHGAAAAAAATIRGLTNEINITINQYNRQCQAGVASSTQVALLF